jgi:hypothetical protein
MNKSAKLLHLDPFAAALAKKEEAEKVARHIHDEESSHSSDQLSSHNLPQFPRELTRQESSNNLPEISREETFQDSSHSEQHLSRHLYEGRSSHNEQEDLRHSSIRDSGNLRSKIDRGLQNRKPSESATPPRRKLDTKKSFSSPQSDRHKTRDGQVNIQPEPELLREIKHFLVDHDMSMREFFEYSARTYLDGVARRLSEGVSSDEALNDLLTKFKTVDNIIRLYSDYTHNRWKLHDDEGGHQFNEADPRYVEIGILNTLLRFKGKRINSFKYFVPEIEEALAVKLADETLGIMLKRRRQQWEAKKAEK